MKKHSFLAATFVALLSTAAFAQFTCVGYVITGSEGQFTAKRGDVTVVGTADQPIQTVIDAIIDAIIYDTGTNVVPCPRIQFGENDDILNIGGDSVQFINDGWSDYIQLSGKIKSENSSPTIKIGQGVSINSEADISNAGRGYAIHNSGQLSITGGTVSTTPVICLTLLITNLDSNDPPGNCVPGLDYSRTPVYHDNEDFPLVLGGSPSIPPSPGNKPGSAPASIYIASGKLKVAPDFAPGAEIYRISVPADIKDERGVVVIDGAAYADNFRLSAVSWPQLILSISGNDLAIFAQGGLPEGYYVITVTTVYPPPQVEVEPTFTATRNGRPTPIATNSSIQAVIDAIRADAVYMDNPIPAHIKFGNGGIDDMYDMLDIGGDSVQFINDDTGGWLRIYLSGEIKSKSSNPTIKIGQGVSISSEAIIANFGGGYAINNSGRLSIIGGTVSTVGSETVSTTPLITNCGSNEPTDNCVPVEYSSKPPVYHDNKDFPLVLGGSPSIPPSSGNKPGSAPTSIYIASGKLKVAPDFDPGTEIYRISVPADNEIKHERGVVVIDGAAYADNFKLSDVTWPVLSLVISGDDLVIGEETAPIIKSKATSGFGIVLNGNSLQVVGISQATPVRVYDLRGNVVMSRTALPNESVSVSHLPKGVYVAKVGGMAVKVVR